MTPMESRARRIVNTTRLHQVNQKAIMDCLRLDAPLSSADLARRFGVPIGTISRLVDRLIRLELIVGQRSARSRVGKPPVLLDLNADFGLFIGLEIGVTCTRLVLTDFKGAILTERSLPTEEIKGDIVKRVTELLRGFRDAETAGRKAPLAGVGIGVSGVVNFETGCILHSFLPVGAEFNGPVEENLGVPALTDNDANLAAWGEHAFGLARGRSHVLGMLDRGWLGSGILIDGRMYRGAFHWTGELSAIEIADRAHPATEGVFATSLALEHEIRRLRYRGVKPGSYWRRSDMLAAMGRAAASGDTLARSLIEGEAARLASILSTLAFFMDPQVLVLSGDFVAAGPEAAKLAQKEFGLRQKRAIKLKGQDLVLSALGQNSVTLGAAAMMIDAVTQSRIQRPE